LSAFHRHMRDIVARCAGVSWALTLLPGKSGMVDNSSRRNAGRNGRVVVICEGKGHTECHDQVRVTARGSAIIRLTP